MQTVPILFLTIAVIYCCKRFLAFISAIRSIQNIPGYRVLFSPTSPIGYVSPRIPAVCAGNNHFFEDKHAPFQSAGWDVTSIVYAFPQDGPALVLADAAAIKELTTARARFPKPAREYDIISIFGPNIVASEGEEWKKYRKISAPAFSDRNNKLVWDETVQIVNSLFKEVWANKDIISVDHAVKITLPIALFVIGAAGFGQPMSWHDDVIIPKGHRMSMKEALQVVSEGTFFKLALPNWALMFTKRLRAIKTAFEELKMYMSEMIEDQQNSKHEERHDLFSNLMAANDELTNDELIGMASLIKTGEERHDLFSNLMAANDELTNDELIGNIYIFLLAGHESTAHSLCFALALLALHADEQEKLYKHIRSVVPDGRIPTYEEMPLLTYSMCVLNETLRMFPPVINIPKISEEDTTLTISNADGEKRTIPIQKGMRLTIGTPGLHYNPRYWKDPHSFKPARFLEDWPRDAFLPFSAGPRACLGRKFFETEAIATLTMIVSQYKISIKKEPQFSGETFEQRKTRVLKCWNGLTLTPSRVPLTFTRRV